MKAKTFGFILLITILPLAKPAGANANTAWLYEFTSTRNSGSFEYDETTALVGAVSITTPLAIAYQLLSFSCWGSGSGQYCQPAFIAPLNPSPDLFSLPRGELFIENVFISGLENTPLAINVIERTRCYGPSCPPDEAWSSPGYIWRTAVSELSEPGAPWLSAEPATVPGPIVGAGVPGLLMAIAGFIGWRRSRLFLDRKAWKH